MNSSTNCSCPEIPACARESDVDKSIITFALVIGTMLLTSRVIFVGYILLNYSASWCKSCRDCIMYRVRREQTEKPLNKGNGKYEWNRSKGPARAKLVATLPDKRFALASSDDYEVDVDLDSNNMDEEMGQYEDQPAPPRLTATAQAKAKESKALAQIAFVTHAAQTIAASQSLPPPPVSATGQVVPQDA